MERETRDADQDLVAIYEPGRVTLVDLVELGYLLLFGAGVLGIPFGVYRAWPKNNQARWSWTPVLMISIPSALLVSVLVSWLILLIRGFQ